jgi:signal transduction histidine kinase
MTTTDTPQKPAPTLALSGKVLGAISAAVGAAGAAVIVGYGNWDVLVDEGVIHMALLAVGAGILALVTMNREARNGAVWAFIWAGFFAALVVAGMTVFVAWGHDSFPQFDLDVIDRLRPVDLPFAVVVSLQPLAWAWLPATLLVMTVGLALFPDGRPPTARWWWLVWYSLATITVASVAFAWPAVPSSTVPFGEDAVSAFGLAGQVAVVATFLAMLGAVMSVVALVVRYRRSSGMTRHQILWIAWGGAIFAAAIAWINVSALSGRTETWESALVLVSEAVLILCFVIAVTRYRLYDIDVVVSRTVTYGALAIFITALYVAIVVGLGNLFGQGDNPNLVLRIGAIAAIAFLFEPVRSRVQRWANRLVYGKRATPYEVLARFSSGAATETDDEVLERIPRLIVDGTGATKATLWKVDGERMRPEAWWPDDADPLAASGPVAASWRDLASDYSVLVEHRGEILGALSLDAGRGESLAPAEEELMQNLAGGLGLAMRNARLTDDLRHQVAALAESRERILTASDEARRDLERDLDMGPQQELVAVKVKLGVVRSRAELEDATQTAEVLGQLEQEVGTAITSVRDFARGVYPPLLEADGLNAAVSAEADKAALPVSVEAEGVGRYSREVETAVFFTVLEALQNAAKYAEPTAVEIRLVDDKGSLTFEVSDDGSGFDPRKVGEGSGIPGMRDRIDAAGGRLAVRSSPGLGTTISGSVPLMVNQPASLA